MFTRTNILIFCAVVILAGIIAFEILSEESGAQYRSDIVSFDSHKLINAQRKKSSQFLGEGNTQNTWKLSSMHEAIEKNIRYVIRDVAGNAAVVAKGAIVIDDNVRDITDEVLNRLGLPTDVLSHNALRQLEQAPTFQTQKHQTQTSIDSSTENRLP